MKQLQLAKIDQRWVLSVREAAVALGISERTCRARIASRRLPAVRLSARRIGITVDDLKLYLAHNQV